MLASNTVAAPYKATAYGFFALTEADRAAFADHLRRLAPADRRLRFGAALTDVTLDAVVARYPLEGTTFGFYVWGELRGTASVIPVEAGRGELAVSLLPALQGRGHGAFMVREALRLALDAGLEMVDIQFLAENKAMAHIAHKYPGKLSLCAGERIKHVDLKAWALAEGIWLGQG